MEGGQKIRIVIADDHRLLREGLLNMLRQEESIEVVGEAVNVLQAIDVIGSVKPDVVLLNTTMLESNGVQIIPVIKQRSLGSKPLMLAAATDDDMVLQALKAGAKGYLSKNTSMTSLMRAIKAVHQGELWVERKLIAKFFDSETTGDSGRKDAQTKKKESLTPREVEVLHLLTNGSTNKEIAEALFISEKTVKSHLNSIFKKLNVSRRLQAILYAITQGLG
jgi:two-component system response regulator DegU